MRELNDEMIEQAAALKAEGATTATVAKALGVARSTLGRWLDAPKTEAQAKLKARCEKEEAGFQMRLVRTIVDAATIEGAATGKKWQAAAWMLERRYPLEYGRPLRYLGGGSEISDEHRPASFADTARAALKFVAAEEVAGAK